MKKIILALVLSLTFSIAFSQGVESAEKLIEEGVAYHDKGDYAAAIAKYDRALELDKNNLFALAEKAYTLLTIGKYDEAIKYCKKAIDAHPNDKHLNTVYVTWGNALDELNKTDKSIEVYDEGIKKFPDYYHLYYNKGISLTTIRKYNEALLCFEKSVSLKPDHVGSHNAIARVSDIDKKRIPAVLAYGRFFTLEPEGKRAKENLNNLKTIMKGGAEKKDGNSISITIDPDMLGDTSANGKPKENSFSTADLLLTMGAALDYDDKYKNETPVKRFNRKFESLCETLKETQKDNYGFFWKFYVPYFIEMKDKNLTETFSYIVFASSEDQEVSGWLKDHQEEIQKFFTWSDAYTWKVD